MKLFLFLLFTSLPLYSQTEMSKQFCDAYFSKNTDQVQNKKNNSNSFKFLLTFIYNPKALIEVEPLNEMTIAHVVDNQSDSKLLFDLIPRVEMTKSERTELKKLKVVVNNNKKNIRGKNFIDSLKALPSKEDCYQYVDTPEITNAFLKFESDYKAYNFLRAKRVDEVSGKTMDKYLKTFRRKGWTVFSGLKTNDIHHQILKAPHSTVLIVGHASENGEVVDSDINILPSTFFKNTEISNLIIYSCYPDQVINFYDINNNHGINNYYKPRLKKISEGMIKENRIPLISLKAVLKEKFAKESSLDLKKECSIQVDNSYETMGVFLNKIFLGRMEKDISFNCDFLKDNDNQIEIYSMTKERILGSLNLSMITLNNRKVIDFNEFVSKATSKHIVTKGKFDL